MCRHEEAVNLALRLHFIICALAVNYAALLSRASGWCREDHVWYVWADKVFGSRGQRVRESGGGGGGGINIVVNSKNNVVFH